MMKQIIYKIESEWNVGLENKFFSTREKALKAAKKIDWLKLFDDTLEDLMDDGYVTIVEHEVL